MSNQPDHAVPVSASLPSLVWDVDEDGARYVSLVGLPNYHITADGKTPEEALHRLGDVLFHVFNDACTEPEAHTRAEAAEHALSHLRETLEQIATAMRAFRIHQRPYHEIADDVRNWADTLSTLGIRHQQEQKKDE